VKLGSATLREEHRLSAFQKSVLRRIFGPKRDEVTGGWRKSHNQELYNLYSSQDIMINSRRMRSVEGCSTCGKIRDVYEVLVGKSKRKRPFRTCSYRWEENKMDCKQGVNVWTGLSWLSTAKAPVNTIFRFHKRWGISWLD
jgi:hypothetical protein